jgi:endonuclease/exonuclease/phosphatase (EEP) superfamily protein YafD
MLRFVVLSAGWLAGATILAGLALRLGTGDELRVARYTGYVMPWLLVGVLPGAVWAWRRRARLLSAVLGLSAALIAVAHLPVLERREVVRPPSALAISVMTFNTWSQNRDEGGIARVVRRRAPDVLLLQEIPAPVFERLAPLLDGMYGDAAVHVAYERTLQQAVISRFPLGRSAALRDKAHAQRVVLRTPAGSVTVLNVHARRDTGWRGRYDQVAALLEDEVVPLATPVIVAGDLNAPEHSQTYALVAARLENAQRAAGTWPGFTYPASTVRLLGVPAFPLVRIDHVFYSRHFVALSAEAVADPGGSDHLPVVAVLALRRGLAPGRAAAVRVRREGP